MRGMAMVQEMKSKFIKLAGEGGSTPTSSQVIEGFTLFRDLEIIQGDACVGIDAVLHALMRSVPIDYSDWIVVVNALSPDQQDKFVQEVAVTNRSKNIIYPFVHALRAAVIQLPLSKPSVPDYR